MGPASAGLIACCRQDAGGRTWSCCASSPPGPRAATPRGGIALRFLRSPVQIRGTARVEAIDVRRNEIVRTDDGSAGAACFDEEVETIERGVVLRSFGYRAVPLPDVPFDERHFVLPNERGRVLTSDREPLAGVYAVGWIKRGPTGILGTNKRDAEETGSCLLEDLAAGALAQPPNHGRDRIDALLAEHKPDFVTVDGWRAIERQELECGTANSDRGSSWPLARN